MRSALMAAVLVASCGYRVDESRVVAPPERAAEATAAVVEAFDLRAAPDVFWYAPDDCGAGAIHDPVGECVFGFRIDTTVVLSTQYGLPIHELALTHELGHLASLEHDGTSDHCHQRRFFLDPGMSNPDCKITSDEWGLIGAENRALAALGM